MCFVVGILKGVISVTLYYTLDLIYQLLVEPSNDAATKRSR